MRKKSGVMPNRLLPFLCCIFLFGCGEDITSYSPEEGEVQWAQLDKDFTKGVTFFVRTQNDTLAATASAVIQTTFRELNYYKLLDIEFEGLKQDTARMDVILMDKDRNETFRFAEPDWESAIRQLQAIKTIEDTLPVVLTCERQYQLSSFPAKLKLNYRIATRDTLVTGSTSFEAVVTKTPGVLRWH